MNRYLLLCVAAICSAAPVDFGRDVHPILAARCFACHSGDKRSGGLSLANYREILRGGKTGKVISPGASSESLLMQRVLGEGVPPMPPAGEKLGSSEIAVLRGWIEQGARERPDSAPARPNWVARMALTRPELPLGDAENPVDRFLSASLPAPVSDAAFARRAYLDIWGLLPSPEQLARFTASQDLRKRQALTRTLLASKRHYSEHWITFWNDLLRNDEGVNYAGTRKSITTWLLKALEDNMPFNQFAAELLDPAPKTGPEGFLMGVNWRGDINASQTPVMQAAQNSAQIFLGVNLKCNSCHDSFISRWKLKDAYGLASFFSDKRLELVRCDTKTGEIAEPRFLYPELGGVDPAASLAERRAAAAHLFTSPQNGRLARTAVNRIWRRLMGRGLVEPVDDMDAEPWNPQLLDWLASDFVSGGYDVKALIETIVTSRAYQMPAVDLDRNDTGDYHFTGPALRRITAEQFMDALSSITGEWRVLITPQKKQAAQVREWRLGSSRLTRALGRPIRDQVFTERAADATTLQALELVNGETLTRFLQRAARKMSGELPPGPANLFDSGAIRANQAIADIDITGAKELRLIVADMGSYSPERVLAVWGNAVLVGPDGETRLGKSKEPVKMKDLELASGLRAKTPSEHVINIADKGYTRFRALVGVEEKSIQSDISANIRFFVFDEKPDMERLVQVTGGPPVPAPKGPLTRDALIARIYRHALGREATPQERDLAVQMLAQPGGLADLLWCVVMLPEFQLIQ